MSGYVWWVLGRFFLHIILSCPCPILIWSYHRSCSWFWWWCVPLCTNLWRLFHTSCYRTSWSRWQGSYRLVLGMFKGCLCRTDYSGWARTCALDQGVLVLCCLELWINSLVILGDWRTYHLIWTSKWRCYQSKFCSFQDTRTSVQARTVRKRNGWCAHDGPQLHSKVCSRYTIWSLQKCFSLRWNFNVLRPFWTSWERALRARSVRIVS